MLRFVYHYFLVVFDKKNDTPLQLCCVLHCVLHIPAEFCGILYRNFVRVYKCIDDNRSVSSSILDFDKNITHVKNFFSLIEY